MARLAGASWQTVADGAAELESGQVAAPGRVRRPGAGRPKLAETDPGLVPALLALVQDSARGDPESPLLWTTKSAAHLAGELTARGHACSRWWQLAGKDAYPAAGRLLVTCDAGGSNGWKNRAWKAGLAALAAETGLEITVLHFPPGTSKWNQIEHRLFSQITLGWRGRPLTSYNVVINTISAVTTRTGLAVTAVLDRNPCPTGTRISDQQVKDIEDRHLTRHGFHGEWNYTVLPVPRPAPEPEPEPQPARPGRAPATC